MAARTTNQVVVDSLLEGYRNSEYPGEDPDDVFEKYAASQILKPRELSTDELAAGIVDGDKDGGIDGFFVFLNGALLSHDDPVLEQGNPALRSVGQHPDLEIFLIQAKNTERWEESTWEHLLTSLPPLLDAQADDANLERLFRASVVERTGILRRAILSLATKFPQVAFRSMYISRAPEANLTDTIRTRSEQVQLMVSSILTQGARVTTEHVGVERLYEYAGTDYSKPGTLKFRHLMREPGSFLGVVELEDYLRFVRNENGDLREELFDFNVRDYEGDNSVNEAISETLAQVDDVEFWWLNNGVTILGDHVDSPQQTLTISRPLIVNGLQTSHVLHRAERATQLAQKRRKNGVVVRVIESTDENVRDRIIAGTNRQTQVPGPALYATQPLQHDIERFLLVHGWYYERRKNRYKNQGKPAKRRITMNYLAQALITLMLAHPDDARARPSTLLSRPGGYGDIFRPELDRNAYLVAAEVMKETEDFLFSEKAKNIMDEFTNARFYLAAGYFILHLRIRDKSNFLFDKNFHRLKRPLKEPTLIKALKILQFEAEKYQEKHPKVSRDAIFKSAEFRDQYFDALIASLPAKPGRR